MNIKESILNIKKELSELQSTKVEKEELRILSIPVPKSYKEKFDELQALSDREFGKLLQDVVKKSIDSV